MVPVTTSIPIERVTHSIQIFRVKTRDEVRRRGLDAGRLQLLNITHDMRWIDDKVDVFIKNYYLQLIPAAKVDQVKRTQFRTNERLSKLHARESSIDLALEKLPTPRKTFVTRMRKRKRAFKIFAFVFAGIDAVLSFSLFEEASESLLVSGLLSLGMPAFLYILAGGLVKVIRSSYHSIYKVGAGIVIVVSVLWLFYYLADLQGFAAQNNSQDVYDSLTQLFFMLSFVVFLGNVIIHFKAPSEDEEKQLDQAVEDAEKHESLTKEMGEVHTKQRELEDTYDTVHHGNVIDLGFLYELDSLGKSVKSELKGDYRIGYSKMAPHIEPQCDEKADQNHHDSVQQFMKKYLTIWLCMILSLGLHSQSLELSLLYDRSDPRIVVPVIQDIQDHYLNKEMYFKAVDLRVQVMSDLSYDYSYDSSIPSANRWMAKKSERRQLYTNLIAALNITLKDIEKLSHTTQNSNIIPIIWNELVVQSKSDLERTVLIVYSDLLHHGEAVSLYDPTTLATFETDPRAILDALSLTENLHTRSDMELQIHYRPKSRQDDKRFAQAVKGWRKLLAGTGIEIIIKSHS